MDEQTMKTTVQRTMARFFVWALFGCVSAMALECGATAFAAPAGKGVGAQHYRIAVGTFSNQSTHKDAHFLVEKAFREKIASNKTGAVSFVKRGVLENLIKTRKVDASILTAPTLSSIPAAKAKGIDGIIVGSVLKLEVDSASTSTPMEKKYRSGVHRTNAWHYKVVHRTKTAYCDISFRVVDTASGTVLLEDKVSVTANSKGETIQNPNSSLGIYPRPLQVTSDLRLKNEAIKSAVNNAVTTIALAVRSRGVRGKGVGSRM